MLYYIPQIAFLSVVLIENECICVMEWNLHILCMVLPLLNNINFALKIESSNISQNMII